MEPPLEKDETEILWSKIQDMKNSLKESPNLVLKQQIETAEKRYLSLRLNLIIFEPEPYL